MKTLLFLCTGNYYRSRYAELRFNALALPGWRADSRGLALSAANSGPISPFVLRRLAERGEPAPADPRLPRDLQASDLAAAALVIALDEDEHRPLMQRRFPGWAGRIRYWRVADLHLLEARPALTMVEAAVAELPAELGG